MEAKGFFQISPPKRKRSQSSTKPAVEKREEIAILVLQPFSQCPYINFNNVSLGSSKTCCLIVRNPSPEPQNVRVVKFPQDKGFTLESPSFIVEGHRQMTLNISWTPEKSANYRETIVLQTDHGCKGQAYLLGTATSPPRRKPGQNKTKMIRPKITINSPMELKSPVTKSEEQVSQTEWKTPLPYHLHPARSEPVDSPTRRQTFLINQMFTENSNQQSILKEIQTNTFVTKTENLTAITETAVEYRRATFIKKTSKSDEFNDSLEVDNDSSNINEKKSFQFSAKITKPDEESYYTPLECN